MDGWLSSISSWFHQQFVDIFTAIVSFLHDAALWIFDQVLSALAALVSTIPAPGFMQTTNIGSLLSGLPPFALYLFNQCGFPAAFAVIASGVAFRLLRKLLTLGQW